jgi:hypothetical protein
MLVGALKSAARNEKGAKLGAAPGIFLADSYCHLPVSVPLLRYQLPSTCYAPPLMAQASHTVLQVRRPAAAAAAAVTGTSPWMSALQAPHRRARAGPRLPSPRPPARPPAPRRPQVPDKPEQALVSICIRFAVSGQTGLQLGEMVSELLVPPSFGQPLKVHPAGQFSTSQNCVRWRSAETKAGAAGVLSALFRVEAGPEAAAAGARVVRGRLRLEGAEGQTLSGTALLQAPNGPSTLMQDFEELCSWSSEVYVALSARQQQGAQQQQTPAQ